MVSDRIVVGTRKGLVTASRGANGWAVDGLAFAGAPVTNVLVDRRDGTWYASLDHGHFGVKLHRSDDAGATWAEIASPTYPTKPEGLVEREPMGRREIPWSTVLAWELAAGHPAQPGVLWCGTIPGGLFRSADRGDSWQIVESLWYHPTRTEWFGGGYDLPGVHSISIDPRGAGERLAIGISCGGAWTSTDGGSSWTVATGMRADFLPPDQVDHDHQQDPHRLARCAADPDVVWVQHHCGIFRSVDGGRTFTEITDVAPSTFGFAVAAHPHDAGTAWFVPAISDIVRVPVDGRMVITRTRDGGRSFDQVGRGLPQEYAQHLVYRHGLAVDDSGDRLALGSTTGSLWVSEDGGDTVTRVSADLAPIACVHFA